VHSKTSSALGYLKDVWVETFPNEDKLARTKIQKRKEIAKLQKEANMSMEDIEAMEG